MAVEMELLMWFATPAVVAAVWPKDKGVPISKTERPVLQPDASAVWRDLLPGWDTPDLLGPSVGLLDPTITVGVLKGLVLEAMCVDSWVSASLAPGQRWAEVPAGRMGQRAGT